LASLRKKKNSEDSNEDIRSYLSQNDEEEDYLAPLNAPKQLSFQFMGGPVGDDEDDDVLLPAFRPGYQMGTKSLDLDISLGKRDGIDEDEEEIGMENGLEGSHLIDQDKEELGETQSLYSASKHLKL